MICCLFCMTFQEFGTYKTSQEPFSLMQIVQLSRSVRKLSELLKLPLAFCEQVASQDGNANLEVRRPSRSKVESRSFFSSIIRVSEKCECFIKDV